MGVGHDDFLAVPLLAFVAAPGRDGLPQGRWPQFRSRPVEDRQRARVGPGGLSGTMSKVERALEPNLYNQSSHRDRAVP